MARDPGSIWKPLPEAGAPDGYAKTQFIVHSTGTMASALANWNYFFRGDVVVESTFIIGWGPDDPTLQIMDSTDNADANGAANQRGISIEVVGDGIGGYNDWQISELIRIGIWAKRTHGILPRIIPSEAAGGYGWHVMFGAPGPWTTVRGKICPGGLRIQQLKTIIFPAIFAGIDSEEDPLAGITLLDISKTVVNALTTPMIQVSPTIKTSVLQQMAYDAQGLALINGKVTGLEEAVKQLALGQGLDPEAIEGAAERGALKALDDLRLVVERDAEDSAAT